MIRKRKPKYHYQINFRCDGKLMDDIDDWLEVRPHETRTSLIKSALREYMERRSSVARSIINSHQSGE